MFLGCTICGRDNTYARVVYWQVTKDPIGIKGQMLGLCKLHAIQLRYAINYIKAKNENSVHN